MARDAERSAIAARARADAMEELFPGSSAEAAEYAAELAANPRKIRDARDCLVADRWVSPERSGYANAYWRGIDRQREHDDGYAAEPYFSRH